MTLLGLLIAGLSTAHAGDCSSTKVCRDACVLYGDELVCDFTAASSVDIVVAEQGGNLGCHGTVTSGAASADFCCAWSGVDADAVWIYGSPGDDELLVNDGTHSIGTTPAYITGGSGQDTIWGSSGADQLYGGPGPDDVVGFAGDDFVCGEEDEWFGAFGQACLATDTFAQDVDTLRGGADDDVLCDVEAASNQLYDGGWGDDRLWMELTGAGGTFTSTSTCGQGFDRVGDSMSHGTWDCEVPISGINENPCIPVGAH